MGNGGRGGGRGGGWGGEEEEVEHLISVRVLHSVLVSYTVLISESSINLKE